LERKFQHSLSLHYSVINNVIYTVNMRTYTCSFFCLSLPFFLEFTNNTSGCSHKRRPCTIILTSEVLCIIGREREGLSLSPKVNSLGIVVAELLQAGCFFYQPTTMVKSLYCYMMLLNILVTCYIFSDTQNMHYAAS